MRSTLCVVGNGPRACAAGSGRTRAILPLLVLLAIGANAPVALAQQGAVVGTVSDAETLAGVSGAQVFVEGALIGALTNTEGTYRLERVPAGSATVTVRLIGYKEVSQELSVTAGQVSTADFHLEQTALRVQDIVVTGLVGETPKVKLPFTVERLDSADMPVPASDPFDQLAGSAPGVTVAGTNGQPGQAPDIVLRGPTSINAQGRNQQPLIVIDGVIQSENATLSDIGTLDIDHIEIVKGAAAASLYGSRAQKGVIQITTKRGTTLGAATSDFMVRAEMGVARLAGSVEFEDNHPYLMNEAGTKFLDADGNEFGWNDIGPDQMPIGEFVLDGDSQSTAFKDKPFPSPAYDNVGLFFDPGETWNVYAALTGRVQDLSYRVSADRYRETGIVDCGRDCQNPLALETFGKDYEVRDEGYGRWNARLNFDARLGNLDIATSGFFSRSTQDDIATQGAAFHSLLTTSPYSDLTMHDEFGVPLLFLRGTFGGNPLHAIATSQATHARARSMGSIDLRLEVNDWLSLEANGSYDRTAVASESYGSTFNRWTEAGSLQETNLDEEAMNASVTAVFSKSFLDGRLVTRARARALGEKQTYDWRSLFGSRFAVQNVPNFGAIEGEISPENEYREIRSLGVFGIVALDYEGRYILDALVRRDGSSLFGPDRRWQTYYRGSLAWRLSQEPWWNVDWVDELKLRGSVGSAGGRPNFYSQYEAYQVESGGIFPRTIGNPELRPEYSVEREVGLNAVLFDDLAIDLTYAWATTDQQILRVPQPGYTGFHERWDNAGEIQSRTWEASLRWAPIDNADTGLNLRLNLDRTRAKISRLDVPDFTLAGFFQSEGEPIGEWWGLRPAENCAEVAGSLGLFPNDPFDCSQFAVNDDGYMVWVGDGNAYTDGIARGLWGTSGEIEGTTLEWGMPIAAEKQSRACLRKHPEDDGIGDSCPLRAGIPVANTQPDLNAGFTTAFRHKGLSLSFLFNAALGFDLFNGRRASPRDWGRPETDQAGKPDELKKPVQYYEITQSWSGTNFEPGGWVKLRELAIGYTLPGDFTRRIFGGAFDRLTVTAIGRNLVTFTKYSGFDPEVGFPDSGVGSSTIDRWDWFQYPNSRTYSIALEVVF